MKVTPQAATCSMLLHRSHAEKARITGFNLKELFFPIKMSTHMLGVYDLIHVFCIVPSMRKHYCVIFNALCVHAYTSIYNTMLVPFARVGALKSKRILLLPLTCCYIGNA